MTHRLLAAMLMFTLAAPLGAQDAPAITKSYVFRVAVDEQGKVGASEPVGEVPGALLPMLAELVGKSEFEPARADGLPVPSRTMVNVAVRFEDKGEDVIAVPVDVKPGGQFSNVAPPVYPFGAMRDNVAAEVMARLSFRADGSLDREASRIEYAHLVRNGRRLEKSVHQKSFEAAIASAMVKWTLVPDEVDGEPIAMTVLVPTRFCPPDRSSRGCDDLWPAPASTRPYARPSDADVRIAVIKPASPVADGG